MSLTDTRSLSDLVSRLVTDLSDLVRKESQLIRAEMSEKLGQVGQASEMLAAGAALFLAAFLCLIAALVLALSKLVDPLWAAIIVAVVAAIIGFILVRAAMAKLKPEALAPTRSAQQLSKDVQMARAEAGAMPRSVGS